MYSRPLETPAQEAERARQLLIDRCEKRVEELDTKQRKTLEERARAEAERERNGMNGPSLRPRGTAQARPSLEYLIEKHTRLIREADQKQLDELRKVLDKEIAEINTRERNGNLQSQTGAQIARDAMNAVEPLAPAPPHSPRLDPKSEFNLQAEVTRGLDPKRLGIEHEAKLDDPDARHYRAQQAAAVGALVAAAHRQQEHEPGPGKEAGPTRDFNQQARD